MSQVESFWRNLANCAREGNEFGLKSDRLRLRANCFKGIRRAASKQSIVAIQPEIESARLKIAPCRVAIEIYLVFLSVLWRFAENKSEKNLLRPPRSRSIGLKSLSTCYSRAPKSGRAQTLLIISVVCRELGPSPMR